MLVKRRLAPVAGLIGEPGTRASSSKNEKRLLCCGDSAAKLVLMAALLDSSAVACYDACSNDKTAERDNTHFAAAGTALHYSHFPRASPSDHVSSLATCINFSSVQRIQ